MQRGTMRRATASSPAVRREVLALYRACLRSANRCPALQHRATMWQYVQMSFRDNRALDERNAKLKLSAAKQELIDMDALHDMRDEAAAAEAAAAEVATAATETATVAAGAEAGGSGGVAGTSLPKSTPAAAAAGSDRGSGGGGASAAAATADGADAVSAVGVNTGQLPAVVEATISAVSNAGAHIALAHLLPSVHSAAAAAAAASSLVNAATQRHKLNGAALFSVLTAGARRVWCRLPAPANQVAGSLSVSCVAMTSASALTLLRSAGTSQRCRRQSCAHGVGSEAAAAAAATVVAGGQAVELQESSGWRVIYYILYVRLVSAESVQYWR